MCWAELVIFLYWVGLGFGLSNWRDSEVRRRGPAGRRKREPNSGGSSTIFEQQLSFLLSWFESWRDILNSQLSLSPLSLFVIVSWRMIFVILYLYTTWRGCDCIESLWNTCFKICQCEGVLSNATENDTSRELFQYIVYMYDTHVLI